MKGEVAGRALIRLAKADQEILKKLPLITEESLEYLPDSHDSIEDINKFISSNFNNNLKFNF